ncbi:MAG TPA: hypothetical protein VH762_12075 [Gemmatimonadaceae bacterium]
MCPRLKASLSLQHFETGEFPDLTYAFSPGRVRGFPTDLADGGADTACTTWQHDVRRF